MIQNFPISGMSCANCAASVEKRLNSIKGVKIAITNLANNSLLTPSIAAAAMALSSISVVGNTLLTSTIQKDEEPD